MSDLHERLAAAVNERLELARSGRPRLLAAGPVHFDGNGPSVEYALWLGDAVLGLLVLRPTQHRALRDVIDPATVIRQCERDLKVLGMHQWRAPGVNCGCDKAMCSCGEHVLWPCEELVWLATAYGIEVQP